MFFSRWRTILPRSLRGIRPVNRTPPRSRSSSATRSVCPVKRSVSPGNEMQMRLRWYWPSMKRTSSSAVTEWPALTTTKAVGSSPSTSCGRPTTAASSTAAWVSRCFSMFDGTTWTVEIHIICKWTQCKRKSTDVSHAVLDQLLVTTNHVDVLLHVVIALISRVQPSVNDRFRCFLFTIILCKSVKWSSCSDYIWSVEVFLHPPSRQDAYFADLIRSQFRASNFVYNLNRTLRVSIKATEHFSKSNLTFNLVWGNNLPTDPTMWRAMAAFLSSVASSPGFGLLPDSRKVSDMP